uniref:Putative ovule protein n=1 Tax=Solanum chacoense TaxID=4108 RepID=A0A0V0HBC9_SOLCH
MIQPSIFSLLDVDLSIEQVSSLLFLLDVDLSIPVELVSSIMPAAASLRTSTSPTASWFGNSLGTTACKSLYDSANSIGSKTSAIGKCLNASKVKFESISLRMAPAAMIEGFISINVPSLADMKIRFYAEVAITSFLVQSIPKWLANFVRIYGKKKKGVALTHLPILNVIFSKTAISAETILFLTSEHLKCNLNLHLFFSFIQFDGYE